MLCVVGLLVGGPMLLKKFLRGLFWGTEFYVILTIEGEDVAYKNPKGQLGHEDNPLTMFPHEILYSDRYETYYNVCWFESGALCRCEHSFHRTKESAFYCDKSKTEAFLIGKVLEQR